MRRPNHASRFEGIAKTKLQASRASDTETLQSQVNKAAKKRLSLSGLEVLHGRQDSWEAGYADGQRGRPPQCAIDLDQVSYSSGFCQGRARRAQSRTKRGTQPLEILSMAKIRRTKRWRSLR